VHWANKALTAEMPSIASVTAVFKLIASVRYFSHAYHKFKPPKLLNVPTSLQLLSCCSELLSQCRVALFKGRRLIPATCVASVLLSSS